MPHDKTLRDDFGELKLTVTTFCAVQEGWNKAHDKHSREVLESITHSIDRLVSSHETLVEKVLTLPCGEHDIRIKSAERVTSTKIKSVEKRITWLWSLVGGGLGATVIGFSVKNLFDYLKTSGV